jgi:hypothetical protein
MPLYSQDNSGRILEIKKMYGDIIKLSAEITTKQCKSGKVINYESFDENSEKMPFEQVAELCTISKDYTTYKSNFCGYEWRNETIYYLNDNKIFFVLIASNAEACSNEYRIYYDIAGNIIKILNKANDCDGEKPIKSSEVTDKTEIKNIVDRINADYKKLLELLK